MARILKIDVENKSDVELKHAIDLKFGTESKPENMTDNKFKN